MVTTAAFKAYDIRGKVPEEVNAELAYTVGRVFAEKYSARKVVVGCDIRLSGPELKEALSSGLCDGGADVLDIGLCGTEMIYFATAHLEADGGIMVTASHNPADYNGMKLVRTGARPVSSDSGLLEIAELVRQAPVPGKSSATVARGTVSRLDIMPAYLEHLLSYVHLDRLQPMKIAANPGNGGAGIVLHELAKFLPYEFVCVNAEPDGTFPHGVPNPLLPQNRAVTEQLVRDSKAQLGIAWDGDFDRCFFVDEQARFIEGYYIVGLLAEVFLRKYPQEKIMYDPRLTWNTVEIVERLGGIPFRCKSGHAFMKECMGANGILYGGEMSAHHYFRSFSYCDSGMLPWLLLTGYLSERECTLSSLVEERMERFPCSGEINLKVENADAVLHAVQERYKDGIQDFLDGLSVEYAEWRFNLRCSNTEPVVRLNVETRGNKQLLAAKTQDILRLIGGKEV